MKLYGFPLSPNTRKVIAVTKHLGLPLELQVVDLGKGEQRRPEFMKLNPNAKTPVLVDGDFVLWESTAIMEYLASKKPGNSLWSNDARQRADISRWLCWTIAHWGPACGIFLWENMIKKMLNMGEPDAARLRWRDSLPDAGKHSGQPLNGPRIPHRLPRNSSGFLGGVLDLLRRCRVHALGALFQHQELVRAH